MLSIIIPTLNEEKFLPRLLESIKRQSFTDYEIIISDGNSTDNTKKIALENNCQFIVDVEHHSPAWQRNNGAAVAQGDLLLFLDADSVLKDDFLEKAVAEFMARNLCGAGFYFVFNPNKFSYRLFSFLDNFFCFIRQFSSAPASVGAGIMARKKDHDAIKGFDPKILLAEDFDYCARLSKQGKFRMIKSTRLLYSARRIEKEGWFRVAYKWGRMATFTLFNKKIKKEKIKYEFGNF
mgnify:CR=1 FL=1